MSTWPWASMMSLATAGVVSTGCVAAIHYDGVPDLPPVHDRPSRCYAEKRLALGGASAEGLIVNDTGMGLTSMGGRPMVTLTHAPDYGHSSFGGSAFYQGGTRLMPRDALLMLDSPSLVARYDAGLDAVKSGRFRSWARPLWISLALTGAALAIAGSVAALTVQPDPNTGLSDYSVPIVILLASLAPLVACIPFIPLDLGYQREGIEYETRRQIIVTDEQMDRELGPAIEQFNAEVAKECGASAPEPAPH